MIVISKNQPYFGRLNPQRINITANFSNYRITNSHLAIIPPTQTQPTGRDPIQSHAILSGLHERHQE